MAAITVLARMKFPFEASPAEVVAAPDRFIDAVFASLASEFLVLPKGKGFVEYADFQAGYEELEESHPRLHGSRIGTAHPVVRRVPICLIVLRSMLGFTPPEWAYVATQKTGVAVAQGFARTLDRRVRIGPLSPLRLDGTTGQRIEAMVRAACELLTRRAPETAAGTLHRLNKADTSGGLVSLQNMAALGAPYPMLLYERFLGRPFAGHRDSVSELVGDACSSRPSKKSLAVPDGGQKFEVIACIAVLLAGEGLQPSSKGARVRFAGDKQTVIDGPFAEAKELVAGFWLKCASFQEASVGKDVRNRTERPDGRVLHA